MNQAGFFTGVEYFALETFQILAPSPNLVTHVRIVAIDDDYFRERLGGRYPLVPAGLKALILAVAMGNPQIIAVDVDTSLWSDKEWDELNLQVAAQGHHIPIIWARDIIRRRSGYCMAPGAGGDSSQYSQTIGIAAVPTDFDGVTRRYRRIIRVVGVCGKLEAPEREPIQTLPWAVATMALKMDLKKLRVPDGDELMLNFFGDRFDFQPISADAAMKAANAPDSQWSTRGSVYGRIALIGGYYHAAHDEHATPRGILSGAEITAQAIESELNHRGLRTANEVKMTVAELLFGIALVIMHFFLDGRWSLSSSIALFFFVAPVGSYFAYSSFALWADFVPILVGVLLHEFYHQAERARQLAEDLKRSVRPACLGGTNHPARSGTPC